MWEASLLVDCDLLVSVIVGLTQCLSARVTVSDFTGENMTCVTLCRLTRLGNAGGLTCLLRKRSIFLPVARWRVLVRIVDYTCYPMPTV